MSNAVPRVLVDTCVILNVILHDRIDDDPSWFPQSRWVLEAHLKDHEVIISALTLAELAGFPKVRGDHIQRKERQRRINLVHKWIENNGMRIVDIDERVGRTGAHLAAKHQLSGADASILGCAVVWNIPTLYTWDSGLLKVGESIDGLSVRQPCRPEPDERLF